MKNLCQYSWSLDRDLNLGPSEYEGVPTTLPQHLVRYILIKGITNEKSVIVG
jgi:hypothetical protein